MAFLAHRAEETRPGDRGGPKSTGRPAESANSAQETGNSAQPSDPDGVPEDMATLVLDKPALGNGQASRSGARVGSIPTVELWRG